MEQHLIIAGPPQFFMGAKSSSSKVPCDSSSGEDEDVHSDDVDAIFMSVSGSSSRGMKLSPPGVSALAKRRAGGRVGFSGSGVCPYHAASATIDRGSMGRSRNHDQPQHPLVSRFGSAMGSVDSYSYSSGRWQ